MALRFLMLCGVLMLCTGVLSAQEGSIVTPEGEVIDNKPAPEPQAEPAPAQAAPEEKKKDDAPIQLPAKWSSARSEQFGLGFFLGEPTGISFRWFFHETQGIDALAAWGWGWDYHQKVIFQVDYLFRFYDLIPIPKGDTALYIGGGLQAGMFDDYRYNDFVYDHRQDWLFFFALRLPGGILYQVKSFPLEVFFEIAFLFDILPVGWMGPDFNVGLGLRFCF